MPCSRELIVYLPNISIIQAVRNTFINPSNFDIFHQSKHEIFTFYLRKLHQYVSIRLSTRIALPNKSQVTLLKFGG